MEGKRYIAGADQRQATFLPECLDEIIEEDNPVRFIRVYVESLDLFTMGFTRSKPAHTGRPGYHPAVLLMLYMYGYLNRIRSSRRLERECARNIELWWLLEKLRPDHNTIADFRKENRKALGKVFRLFVLGCRELNLVGGVEACIDGTPIRAVNSKDCATNRALSQKKLAYAKAQLALIEQYMDDLDAADKADQGRLDRPFALDISKERLPDAAELRRRIAFHEENLRIMEESGEDQLLFTDPDARMMRMKDDSSHPAYNIQTAVDTKHHLIVGFEVTNTTDMGQLCGAATATKETLNVETLAVIADKGYESGKDIEKCLMNGIIPDVGFKYDREERVFNLDHAETIVTEEKRRSTNPEDIRACLHAGVLPKCYEGSNIHVELQHLGELSCFLRHGDGRVTCPMGRELFKHTDKKLGTVYGSREACRTCPNRCTDSKAEKTVLIGYNSNCVPVLMYGSSRHPLQKIPEGAKISAFNHALERKSRAKSKVKVTIRRDVSKQKLRMQVSEHPFGTLKWYDGYHYFLCKGKEKVEAETALAYISYNMRRAMNILGVKKLTEYFQGIAMQKCRK